MATILFDDTPAHGRIEALWAYLSVHQHGEGICAAPLFRDDVMTPLVFAQISGEGRAKLREIAADIAKLSGRPVRLVRFSRIDVVETIQP